MPASAVYRRRMMIAIAILFFLYTMKSSLPARGTFASPRADHIDKQEEVAASSEEEALVPDTEVIKEDENVAVIIEDRPLEMIVPILLHFSSVLGPQWPIIVYTTQEIMPSSPSLQRAIGDHRISVRSLPEDIHFATQDSVSDFLTMPWLWEQLAPAGHVLLFQVDSMLCSNSPLRVDDFLGYDFVGAPINPALGVGEGYNGGLSLRNRSMVLDIVTNFDWQRERQLAENPNLPTVQFEDQWFGKKMREAGANLPSQDVAMTFAVETLWYDTPLGFHQVSRWQAGKLEDVYKFCPEYRMASGGAF